MQTSRVPHENDTVAVIGAGIVGTCCALELQRRGARVTLIDRKPPGSETSYGNAGVMARSSLIPFNHPHLWSMLPKLLRNRSTGFRYSPSFVARNLPWACGFLARARTSAFDKTATALDSLIRLSLVHHKRLLDEANASHRLRDNGWLMLYRSDAAFAAGRFARSIYERFSVATETLTADALRQLEPALAPIFAKALWIKDACSVDDPGAVVAAYAALFAARGGTIQRSDVTALARTGNAWTLRDSAGRSFDAARVVIALGPWSNDLLAPLGLRAPMAFERGYHMHYGAPADATLGRPIHDTAAGYVLTPMARGLRLTTGVELAARDAPPKLAQLDLAERAAREAFPLGTRLDERPWLGSRPTLPDCRPMIGEAPRHAGLWLAFGHQHIGFSSGPGTAALLGSLMSGEPAPIDAAPFRPERFIG